MHNNLRWNQHLHRLMTAMDERIRFKANLFQISRSHFSRNICLYRI